MIWYNNLDCPQKLTIGPWAHSVSDSTKRIEYLELLSTERLRWFDYWLKGIENGILKEPSINYVKIDEPKQWTWVSSGLWPIDNNKLTYYFEAGSSGSVASANDGNLSTTKPNAESEYDHYKIDLSTTSGKHSRFHWPVSYPDMTTNDQKGLTYTCAPLKKDITLAGSPIVTLYISTNVPDLDFFVYLEEVDKNGISNYVTEGMLRASHRTIVEPKFKYMSLPYHRSFREDIKLLEEGKVTELKFALFPINYIFNENNRVRVTITCADMDNAGLLGLSSTTPELKMYRNKNQTSKIILPVLTK